ncbi:MAG: PTS lactose/cellobiose transporter subunit IIA [Caldibacillus debilis]|nr:MAG: PTS lactose/cellobiose transporter subunit IIA [Caldibacillus debilis]
MMDRREETIFQMILHSGNGKSLAMEAISFARMDNFSEAENALKEAEKEINEAHRVQTALIQEEVRGKGIPVSLLMVHAQDHLMTAITVKELANELIRLYRKMNGGEKE